MEYDRNSTVFQKLLKNGRIPYKIFFAPRIQTVGCVDRCVGRFTETVDWACLEFGVHLVSALRCSPLRCGGLAVGLLVA